MRIAIMQPYLFPYLGYFQLINAVDKFVVFDDVSFIKQGWINRNFILMNGTAYLFTIPVQHISSNKLIKNTIVSSKPCNWERRLLQTVIESYRKAPLFKDVFPVIEDVFTESAGKTIAEISRKSIDLVMKYLQIRTPVIPTSTVYKNDYLKNAARVIDICQKESASAYMNLPGGSDLYNKSDFSSRGIQLQFIKPVLDSYVQFEHKFVSPLSIVDVLMFNKREKVLEMLEMYEVD